ncbi:MAG: hypothetical protein ACREGD_04910 [Candidatus Saccharimonadales bacterium]
MSDKQSEKNADEDMSLSAFYGNAEADYLLKDNPKNKQTQLIECLIVKPGEQARTRLGSFTQENPPKGFSVELNPDPDPPNSVVTKITSMGNSRQYALVLHVANYSNKTIKAEVRQL